MLANIYYFIDVSLKKGVRGVTPIKPVDVFE
jgi:hypothetical protein